MKKFWNKLKNLNFARNGRWFVIAPATIILVGLIILCFFGFNLGLDFTGGTIVSVVDDGTYTKQQVEEKMATYNVTAVVNSEELSEGGNKFSIKFNAGDADSSAIIADLREFFNNGTDNQFNEDTIGAVTSQEKIMNVFWSILAALAGLIIYMLIRFKFTAGVATILALAHDVLMICALTILFRIEIGASFIAAILTVMSYSINNSLVVFDRVRYLENHNTENYTLEQILNMSVRRTLGRCVLTVTTTLATLIVLTIISIVMNLSSLIQFTLPIVFGLFAGTYSSLFLIAPMYLQFESARLLTKKRKVAAQ